MTTSSLTGTARPATVPADMAAVEISRPGPPEVLTTVRRPVPVPGAGEVLIRVVAAGVNRPDCLQRQGSYPPPPGASDLPGLEVSGTVVAAGPGVTTPAVGDRVCWPGAAMRNTPRRRPSSACRCPRA
jgi:NADPH2:quinone reductase